MNDNDKRHWFFRVHVVDRPGALTSIASAFSNEGINLNTVIGHTVEKLVDVNGSVVLSFCCSEQEKDIMVHKVKRLSKVVRLEERSYESESLRKSVIILTSRSLKPQDVAGKTSFLTCELVKNESSGWTYFLVGSSTELDVVLKRLKTAGVIEDLIYSVLGL